MNRGSGEEWGFQDMEESETQRERLAHVLRERETGGHRGCTQANLS